MNIDNIRDGETFMLDGEIEQKFAIEKGKMPLKFLFNIVMTFITYM